MKEINDREGCALLRALGFAWKPLKQGYYQKRGSQPWAHAHRKKAIPWLEYAESRPELFVVLYWDEAGMRKRVYQNCAWVAEGPDPATGEDLPDHTYDERRETGKGPGYHVGVFLRNDLDNPVFPVFVEQTGDKGKDSIHYAPKFLNYMRKYILI